jgi:hypothetical protein
MEVWQKDLLEVLKDITQRIPGSYIDDIDRGKVVKQIDLWREQVGNVAKPNACAQLCEVTELIIDAVNIDGAHHKQWYLEQIAVKLGIELPEHEKGIIP